MHDYQFQDLRDSADDQEYGNRVGSQGPKGVFLGDLIITTKEVTWCPGKTSRANGHKALWKDFIKAMADFPTANKPKPARAAAKVVAVPSRGKAVGTAKKTATSSGKVP